MTTLTTYARGTDWETDYNTTTVWGNWASTCCDANTTAVWGNCEKEGAEAVCDLQPVACLGCCTAAPAVEIDGKLLDKDSAKMTIIKLKGEK